MNEQQKSANAAVMYVLNRGKERVNKKKRRIENADGYDSVLALLWL